MNALLGLSPVFICVHCPRPPASVDLFAETPLGADTEAAPAVDAPKWGVAKFRPPRLLYEASERTKSPAEDDRSTCSAADAAAADAAAAQALRTC